MVRDDVADARSDARAFAIEEIEPYASQVDRDNAIPGELKDRLAAQGLLRSPPAGGLRWAGRILLGAVRPAGGLSLREHGRRQHHDGVLAVLATHPPARD